MPSRKVYTHDVRFEFELAGRAGELLTLYERGGDDYVCVEGQTGTHQLVGGTRLGNAQLNALQMVAQVNRKFLSTRLGLTKAIGQYVELCHPTSFKFTAQQVGNPQGGEVFRGKARVNFPESPMKGHLDDISFD